MRGGGLEKVSRWLVEYESRRGRESRVCNWQEHNYSVCPFKECFPLVLRKAVIFMFLSLAQQAYKL